MTEESDNLQAIVAARDIAIAMLRAQNAEFLQQLLAKEANIQTLKSALDAATTSHESAIRSLAAEREHLAGEHAQSTAQLVDLRTDLEEKESLIASLKRAYDEVVAEYARVSETLNVQLREKDAALELMARQKENLLASVGEARDQAAQQHFHLLQEIDAKISSLASEPTSAPASETLQAALLLGLEQKEACIRELSAALDAYRFAHSKIEYLAGPLRGYAGLRRKVGGSLRRIGAPRLGNLNQHPPADLSIPKHYALQKAPHDAPRISIVTPSYMQAAFIERTIDSVVGQGYPNLQYFVQDGGSDDTTREILERRAAQLSGWQSERDGGQAHAINLGFARSDGDIMAWLNSDDVLLPGALAYVAEYFARHPDIDVIYGHRLLIDENDRQIGRWIMPRHNDNVLSWADFVPQETLFWRRSLWQKVGEKVDESFRFAMDWDLLLRMREAGARFARVPRALGAFRIHTLQKTSATISDVGFKEMDRLRERALGKIPSSAQINAAIAPYLIRHICADFLWRLRTRW